MYIIYSAAAPVLQFSVSSPNRYRFRNVVHAWASYWRQFLLSPSFFFSACLFVQSSNTSLFSLLLLTRWAPICHGVRRDLVTRCFEHLLGWTWYNNVFIVVHNITISAPPSELLKTSSHSPQYLQTVFYKYSICDRLLWYYRIILRDIDGTSIMGLYWYELWALHMAKVSPCHRNKNEWQCMALTAFFCQI